MELAFIKPNFPNETRVAILPNDLAGALSYGIIPIVEEGFGETLGIPDDAYKNAGAVIKNRQSCYKHRFIFNLKLTQPSDYPYLRSDHVIIGWTHPYGSGNDFYTKVAGPLGVTLVDVDSVAPRVFRGMAPPEGLDIFPPHMFWKNSYNAGIASVRLAMDHFRIKIGEEIRTCVLGSGSVSQGAFYELSRLGFIPRMFYRKTMHLFQDSVSDYDVIVNGIEVDSPGIFIMDNALLGRTRETTIVIDAAADAGNAIEGTAYHTLTSPSGWTAGRRYLLVNNAPTYIAPEASCDISKVVAEAIIPGISRNLGRL